MSYARYYADNQVQDMQYVAISIIIFVHIINHDIANDS